MAEEIVVETQTTDEGKTSEPLQERSAKEIAEYNLKKQAEKARELGIDPTAVLGIKPPMKVDETLDDNTPLTIGTYKQFQKEEAHKTALQLADSIEDEAEREDVKSILTNRIKPSGDAQADLALARSAANAVRTTQIAEEAQRKAQATRTASGGSAPAKTEERFEPTPAEANLMNGFGLTKEKILEARRLEAEKRK